MFAIAYAMVVLARYRQQAANDNPDHCRHRKEGVLSKGLCHIFDHMLFHLGILPPSYRSVALWLSTPVSLRLGPKTPKAAES